MDIYIDYAGRAEKLRDGMESRGIDLFLGTRGKSVNYIAGAFVPWRSVLLASREGYLGLHTLLMDAERVKDDSWMENVVPCAPLPGAELWEVTVRKIRELGLERATIGVELGHSPRVIAGYLFATEYDYLKEQLPDAHFVNALDLMVESGHLEPERPGRYDIRARLLRGERMWSDAEGVGSAGGGRPD